jgi:hypothetical protein
MAFTIAAVAGAVLLGMAGLLINCLTRRNMSMIDQSLDMETWPAVSDGMHNSNSYLVFWNNAFWMIQASSPYHFSTPKSKLVLWRSEDAKDWSKVREFNIPGEDIRDPKLAVIGSKLYLYVLKSVSFRALPYATAFTSSDDGLNWAPIQDIPHHKGWIFWTPRTFDGVAWYVAAYWHQYGKAVLMQTENGSDFKMVSVIHQGDRGKNDDWSDETDIGFFSDGTMISTQRLEYSEHLGGDKRACTNITLSKPPYTSWEEAGKDYTTRLDGPELFSLNGRVYALGRFNPYKPKGPLRYYGSLFAKKRTALFEVTENGLIHLSDVPSAGDTAYGAVVKKDGYIYACYYTSNIKKDWPWIMGMVSASEIRIVKFESRKLEALSDSRRLEYKENKMSKFFPA